MSIALRTDQLKLVLETYPKKDKVEDLNLDGKKTTISFTDANKDLLEFLHENLPLSGVQKAKIGSFLFAAGDIDGMGDVEVSSPLDLYKKLAFITHSPDPVFELKMGDNWYPVMGSIEKWKGMTGNWMVYVTAHAQVTGMHYSQEVMVGSWVFETDDEDVAHPKTINEILAAKNIRMTTKAAIEKAKKSQAKIPEIQSMVGKVLDGWGEGLTFHRFWGWSSINVGWQESPSVLVVEPTLENEYARHSRYDREEANAWQLPFVRVFSFKHKDYIWIDVNNVQKHEFHRDGINKIVLPPKMLTALSSIFNSVQKNIFGDLFHGRHGGIVVLANGPSGVGKTLTAEVFAEFQERPLYTMEMGEIGTNLESVEANLQKIFARAKKWNAVLLFDEADIFLSERVASDLERSAIVGIFLRLLDYYEGTFFLTTNRGEGIDKAFKSRVTLYLDYPHLTAETRGKIWTSMLAAAGITVTETTPWADVLAVELNGRQIRNQVRLLKMMHLDGQITTADITSSMEFTTR